VKAIASVFFANKFNLTLQLNTVFFFKLISYLMILVTTEIHHAIHKYKKSHKITLRFEKVIAENIYINFLQFLFLMILLNNKQYTDYLIDLLITYCHVRHT